MIGSNLSQARPASNNELNGISNNYGRGQPLLFSPAELIRCGQRDAHNFPLVGQRYEDGGIRAWREPPEIAWDRQLIELARTATSYAGLVFDCDSRESIELAAGACGGTGPVPPPNFASARTASGHLQVGYFLGRPVHRGAAARVRPLAFLARVSEYYRAALGADPGFVGVLCSNPVHGDYSTTYPRFEPYSLPELASFIPRGWRVPKVATTEVGRNWAFFKALCKRSLKDSDRELEVIAYRLADEARRAYLAADHPFTDSEVRSTLRSVFRYRAEWRARGHKPSFLLWKAKLGRRGGVNRRAAVRQRDLQIVVALDAGLSQRGVAAVVGVSRRTVRTARKGSLGGGGLRTIQIDPFSASMISVVAS